MTSFLVISASREWLASCADVLDAMALMKLHGGGTFVETEAGALIAIQSSGRAGRADMARIRLADRKTMNAVARERANDRASGVRLVGGCVEIGAREVKESA